MGENIKLEDNIRFVIFSGANERAIIAVCRHFQLNKRKVSIIGIPHGDKLHLTSFRKLIDVYRKNNQLDEVDLLDSIVELSARYPHDKLVFLPTSESINRIILNKRKDFNSAGLNIYLVSKNVYESVSDKEKFLELANNFSILVPPLLEKIQTEDLPIVAKPRAEFSLKTGKKIYPELIFTQQQLDTFLLSQSAEDYFYQKYLDGKSYYYLLHFPEHDAPFIIYQQNLLQQENGKSIIMAERCDCPDEDFEKKIVNALRFIGFFGLIMIEMMKVEDKSYLIEANPRLWGPFELAIKSGLLPEFILNSKSLGSVAINGNTKYLWLGGYSSTLCDGGTPRRYLNKELSLLKILPFFVCSDIYLRKDTIGLFFYELYDSIKNWFKKRFIEKQ